jgi:hypothetical protein
MSSRRRTALGGDVDHSADKRTKPRWNEWEDEEIEEPETPTKEESTPPKSSP